MIRATVLVIQIVMDYRMLRDPSRCYEVLGWIADLGRWVNNYPLGGAFPATPGGYNSDTPVTSDIETKLRNEGRSDQKALDAF
jgi:hypothetical protein